jgi:hypothetical protein
MRSQTQNDVDFKGIRTDEEGDRIHSVLDNLTISDGAENQLNDLKKKLSEIMVRKSIVDQKRSLLSKLFQLLQISPSRLDVSEAPFEMQKMQRRFEDHGLMELAGRRQECHNLLDIHSLSIMLDDSARRDAIR